MITNEQRQELRQFILENFDLLGLDESLKPLWKIKTMARIPSRVSRIAKHAPDKLKKLGVGFKQLAA